MAAAKVSSVSVDPYWSLAHKALHDIEMRDARQALIDNAKDLAALA